tara:strand:- start:4525 stop:5787 length:1263 start_codon:yes stop_codon:yes gene_type:complete
MIEFRDYQQGIIDSGSDILKKHGFLYLAMEVRTGKTFTSLGIASKLGFKKVLFLTKKKAISSIESDYVKMGKPFFMFTINYESIHKTPDVCWDLIILDETHGLGAFPKPSKRAKEVKALMMKIKPRVIMLSGTPTPESYSQMYHQVYGIPRNPFSEFANFYKFAHAYVNIKQKIINGFRSNDYSDGSKKIIEKMAPYTISYTQQEAGFESKINEHFLECTLKQSTYDLIARLKKDLVIEGKEEVLLADTGVKLMSKLHQLFSGTVKFESGKSMVVDDSKAMFIKEHFKDQKIGIFYKFTAELEALKSVFGDMLCTELEEFDTTDKNIALQIVSGREGISLRNAESLVYFNIDFSATSYWQSRDRMTTIDRPENNVYWVFSKKGIESQIYKAVSKKKNYTINHFKKDFVNKGINDRTGNSE